MTGLWDKIHRSLVSPTWAIMVPYGWGVLFCLIPFLLVFKISLADLKLGLPPYGSLIEWLDNGFLIIRLNLGNYTFIGEDSLYLLSYVESLTIAIISTIGCLLIGYPMAYGLVKASPSLRPLLLMLVVIPFWTSFLLRAYAWIGILSPHGLLNTALIRGGVIDQPLALLDTHFAAILGIIYCYVPFMILPLYASLEKINPALLEAAYDLGARPLQAFWHIVAPLSLSGVISGSLLVLIPAAGEFVIPELLGGSQTMMIGKVLWNEFFTNRDWPIASALAIVLLAFLLIPLAIFQRLQERQVRLFNA